MIGAAARAFSQILSPPFRSVLWRSIGLTVAMLAAVWAIAYGTLTAWVDPTSPGLSVLVDVITGIGLAVGLGFLVAPVTSMFAGLFLDEIAEEVERSHYPFDRPGVAMPLWPSLWSAIRFTALVVAVNILVLFLLLLPGINILAFFVANAYLLGREYFELVAARFYGREGVQQLRRDHGARVFFAGLIIAAMLAVPILNLLTPLFATAFMTHVFKDVVARHGGPPIESPMAPDRARVDSAARGDLR